eukprot:4615403-Pleurochrysis_carterae.AAC.1
MRTRAGMLSLYASEASSGMPTKHDAPRKKKGGGREGLCLSVCVGGRVSPGPPRFCGRAPPCSWRGASSTLCRIPRASCTQTRAAAGEPANCAVESTGRRWRWVKGEYGAR